MPSFKFVLKLKQLEPFSCQYEMVFWFTTKDLVFIIESRFDFSVKVSTSRSSRWRCFVRGFLKNFAKFTGKHPCFRDCFLIKLQAEACNVIKKEALAQMFSCEFSESFKNSFFYLRWLLLHISLTNSSNSHDKSSESRVWPFKPTQVSLFVYTTHQVHIRKNHKANGSVKFNNIKMFWKSLSYTSYSVHLPQKCLKKSCFRCVWFCF